LTSTTANVVNAFSLPPHVLIDGLRGEGAKPILFIFEIKKADKVIECFSEKISEMISQGEIVVKEDFTVKAVAWSRDHEKPENLCITRYFPGFNSSVSYTTIRHNCLASYLCKYKESELSFKDLKRQVLNALIRVLRIESIHNSNGKYYNKWSCLKYLKELGEVEYYQFKTEVYQVSRLHLDGKIEEAIERLRSFCSVFLSFWNQGINHSKSFIEDEYDDSGVELNKDISGNENFVNYHGFPIQIGTVHSVKGQTHDVTLYLESFVHSHEGDKVHEQILLKPYNGKAVRKTEALKMMYVGLSRPKQLTCLAIEKSRFERHLSDIDPDAWKVIFV
jgi:DNA helicase-2/ATP-dependent DNA helicase PcrA